MDTFRTGCAGALRSLRPRNWGRDSRSTFVARATRKSARSALRRSIGSLRDAPKDNRVEMGSLRGSRIDSSTLIARLQYLEGLRVADRAGPGSWTLAAGWQDQVRDLKDARRHILKQMHLAVHGDRSRYHVVRVGEAITPEREGSSLVGRVAAKGLSDELKGSYFAVLETPSGRAYHVPIDGRAAEELRVGDLVSFTTRPEPAARPVDREIAETARSSDGRYAPPAGADGREHPHVRRLRDLQRMGLAVREAGDGWKVVPNLLRALEDRARSGPSRHRLFVQKQPLSLGALVTSPRRALGWTDSSLRRWRPTGSEPRWRGRRSSARAFCVASGLTRGTLGGPSDLQEAERLAVGREGLPRKAAWSSWPTYRPRSGDASASRGRHDPSAPLPQHLGWVPVRPGARDAHSQVNARWGGRAHTRRTRSGSSSTFTGPRTSAADMRATTPPTCRLARLHVARSRARSWAMGSRYQVPE